MENRRNEANRKNSAFSTGPKSPEGKAVASLNALKHGVLSKQVVLETESAEEFAELLAGLRQSLLPTGALEDALVQKIAIALWRQSRLVRAERAAVELRARVDHRETLNVFKPILRGDDPDFEAPEDEQIEYCEAVRVEIDSLPDELTVANLAMKCPTIHQQLLTDAEGGDPQRYLDTYEREDYNGRIERGPTYYLADLSNWCSKELRKQKNRLLVASLLPWVRDYRLAPVEHELLPRYQAALDGELYRAIRALREAQEWRLKTMPLVGEAQALADEEPANDVAA